MGIWSPGEALLGAGRYSRWAGGLRRPSPSAPFPAVGLQFQLGEPGYFPNAETTTP